MRLSELLDSAGLAWAWPECGTVDEDPAVGGIVADSRRVAAGSLFVCMPTPSADTHEFLPDVLARGAVAAVVHSRRGWERASQLGLPAVLFDGDVPEFNERLCRLCSTYFGHPTRTMKVVGVTGTNGKSTIAWLLRDMLGSVGLRSGYLGTLGFLLPDEEIEVGNTTPFPVEYYGLVYRAALAGVEALAIEASSHALEERRIEGTEFDCGVFSNLSRDHLDFHGSMDAYAAAKRRLFEDLPRQSDKPFTAVLGVDDEVGRRWAEEIAERKVLYRVGRGDERWRRWEEFEESSLPGVEGLVLGLDARATFHRIDMGLLFLSSSGEKYLQAEIPIGASYNVDNCLAASAAMIALGYEPHTVRGALEAVTPVPGRFEPVPNDQRIGVIVDYAHTPDALDKLLEAVQSVTRGRIITVFSAGGDRDRGKRREMGAIAASKSDVSVVTTGNPRGEAPESIIEEILPGIPRSSEVERIVDRREAVERAIALAEEGDVVVIAGKGHERFQTVGRERIPMEDRELAREALKRRREQKHQERGRHGGEAGGTGRPERRPIG
jgi:UDP-N-acetylmuramoyl-L-alanyl-D-glutamate--2,6-diaminopimelate ligase